MSELSASGGAVDDLTKDKSRKPSALIALGVILLAAGIIGAVVGFVDFVGKLKNPSTEAVETLTLEYPSFSENATLEEGRYDIWYERGFFGFGDPGDVRVLNPHGEKILDSSYSSTTESITIGDEEFEKKGTFYAEEFGNYTFESDFSSVLYITPHLDFGSGMIVFLVFLVIAIVGVVILVIGASLYLVRKKRSVLEQHIQPYSAQPIQPAPSPSYGIAYPCPKCGWTLRYVSTYQRWYCDNCRKYL